MPTKPRPYRARLHDLTSVRQEAARLYRSARSTAGDDIGPDAAYKLASLLSIIAKLIEGSETEQQLAEVRRHLGLDAPPAPRLVREPPREDVA